MQEKYWKYMVQIKAWIFYLDVYTEDSYRWDRIINIVVAIASSTSIAAWAIWQKYSFVWSIIIAISQVLTTIKGFLPYSKRLKMLGKVFLNGRVTILVGTFFHLSFVPRKIDFFNKLFEGNVFLLIS